MVFSRVLFRSHTHTHTHTHTHIHTHKQSDCDESADMWSVGVILYVLLTRQQVLTLLDLLVQECKY